jgi:hypothetical protein
VIAEQNKEGSEFFFFCFYPELAITRYVYLKSPVYAVVPVAPPGAG